MAAPDNRIQTRVSVDLHEWLRERADRYGTGGSVHLQAAADLAMLRALVARELSRVRLSLGQVNCLADLLNGTMIAAGEMAAFPAVAAECADAFQLARTEPFDGDAPYGQRWGIDEDRLLAYLRSIGPTTDHAIADAINRWWALDEQEATVQGWAAVGLLVRSQESGSETAPVRRVRPVLSAEPPDPEKDPRGAGGTQDPEMVRRTHSNWQIERDRLRDQ